MQISTLAKTQHFRAKMQKMPVICHNVTMVLGVKCTELQQNWTGHRPIIGFPGVQIRFRCVASFRNEGDRKKGDCG